MLVGNAGVLVTRVLRVKEGSTRTFVILDAGMNDLLRPTLYGAWHAVVPVREAGAGMEMRDVDIVGPICETSDMFGCARKLPPVAEGDLLAIRTVGAYGRVMASSYNGRALPPEVLVDKASWAVVQERVTIEDVLARQHLPPWLVRRDETDTPVAARAR
jgi:diaminopimelate decarboxylase